MSLFPQVRPYVHRTTTLHGSLAFLLLIFTYNKAILITLSITPSKATTTISLATILNNNNQQILNLYRRHQQ